MKYQWNFFPVIIKILGIKTITVAGCNVKDSPQN